MQQEPAPVICAMDGSISRNKAEHIKEYIPCHFMYVKFQKDRANLYWQKAA